MKRVYLILFLVGAFVLSAGCNSLPAQPGGTNTLTSNTEMTSTLTTGPTDAIPLERAVTVSVAEKDPIYNTLDVTFAGGNGQIQVKDIDVVFTGSDGTTLTKKLNPVKGELVTFQGSKGTDKVVAYINYFNGNRYKVVDQLVQTRTREPAFPNK
jgi:ABC-type Fe3+-hydroxamate transport system substrate-binding protein